MKATGIVRRIDDLGRVVIPKEIRRTMRLRDGEAFKTHTEFFFSVLHACFQPGDTDFDVSQYTWEIPTPFYITLALKKNAQIFLRSARFVQ